jgi:hypothetical protein
VPFPLGGRDRRTAFGARHVVGVGEGTGHARFRE